MAAAIGVLVLAAGCSSASTSTSSSPSTTTTLPGASANAASGPAYEVRTGQVSGLGTVLVDGQGFTLYLFVPDHQSGESSCNSTCAQGWPPLILPTGVTAPVSGSGVQASLLGTTMRSDGSRQVTYNRWPLYTWVGDSSPGQATGQGINSLGGLWYVLSPSGQEITTKPSS